MNLFSISGCPSPHPYCPSRASLSMFFPAASFLPLLPFPDPVADRLPRPQVFPLLVHRVGLASGGGKLLVSHEFGGVENPVAEDQDAVQGVASGIDIYWP